MLLGAYSCTMVQTSNGQDGGGLCEKASSNHADVPDATPTGYSPPKPVAGRAHSCTVGVAIRSTVRVHAFRWERNHDAGATLLDH